MVNKYIYLLLASLVAFALSTQSANAQDCTTQYGGGQYGTTTCNPNDLTINKEVKNPVSNVYVENLSATDATYSPGSEVLFKLTIKNGSGETFNPVTVRDVLPEHFDFVAGPGTYNKDNRTLTFALENMIAGQTRVVEVLTKVQTAGLPNDLFCKSNQSFVSALNRNDEDSAQVCVTSKVLGATTLPVAGFNDLALLLPFAGLGIAGMALLAKKK